MFAYSAPINIDCHLLVIFLVDGTSPDSIPGAGEVPHINPTILPTGFRVALFQNTSRLIHVVGCIKFGGPVAPTEQEYRVGLPLPSECIPALATECSNDFKSCGAPLFDPGGMQDVVAAISLDIDLNQDAPPGLCSYCAA